MNISFIGTGYVGLTTGTCLAEVGHHVTCDPVAMESTRRFADLEGDISYADDMLSALDGADALVIATEWPQFASADLSEIKARLRTPLVFDGRNLLDPGAAATAGIEYHSIGR